ncbi:hypothetical protein CRG98_016157 [Punica granatum]|uniref:Uncharacterized protein n=1 Tax=Punica granatum TaxID=22663 RepID=A0A2I0K5P4_PUNGR|nr:hypothetical protein CRG98_016157 [Punica granatum]
MQVYGGSVEVALALEVIHFNAPNVSHTLKSLSEHRHVLALVIDFFCMSAVSVAKELGTVPLLVHLWCGALPLKALVEGYRAAHEKWWPKVKNLHKAFMICLF